MLNKVWESQTFSVFFSFLFVLSFAWLISNLPDGDILITVRALWEPPLREIPVNTGLLFLSSVSTLYINRILFGNSITNEKYAWILFFSMIIPAIILSLYMANIKLFSGPLAFLSNLPLLGSIVVFSSFLLCFAILKIIIPPRVRSMDVHANLSVITVVVTVAVLLYVRLFGNSLEVKPQDRVAQLNATIASQETRISVNVQHTQTRIAQSTQDTFLLVTYNALSTRSAELSLVETPVPLFTSTSSAPTTNQSVLSDDRATLVSLQSTLDAVQANPVNFVNDPTVQNTTALLNFACAIIATIAGVVSAIFAYIEWRKKH